MTMVSIARVSLTGMRPEHILFLEGLTSPLFALFEREEQGKSI